MKQLGQLTVSVVVVAVALQVVAGTVPRLLPAAAIIFTFVVIGRVVFFLTRRDRW
jgi:hypothetical protein